MQEVKGDKPGDSGPVKTGTAFKAAGSESFVYEPHLLLELSLERKAKRKAGVEHEGEGRMIQRPQLDYTVVDAFAGVVFIGLAALKGYLTVVADQSWRRWPLPLSLLGICLLLSLSVGVTVPQRTSPIP